MSIDATRWAWEIQGISIAQKLVLLSMADRAGENNECWPSIKRIMKDTCCGNIRTVINSIKELEKLGYIRSEKTTGKLTRYWLEGVKERHEETGVKSASGKSDTSGKSASGKSDTSGKSASGKSDTGGKSASGRSDTSGKSASSKSATQPVAKVPLEPTSEPTNNLKAVNPPLVPPTPFLAPPKTAAPSAPPDPTRGTRLPPGWRLPKSLGEWAVGQGVTEGSVRQMGEAFADYWHSVPGERGRKCDWEATWRNWVRRENDRAPPTARTGYRPRNAQLEVEAANAAALMEAKRKFREELAAKAEANEEQRA